MYSGEMKNKGYAKRNGANKEYYGKFTDGECMRKLKGINTDSGRSRPSDGGRGGGNGHPDPEIRRGAISKKNFSALRASVWSKYKGRGEPLGLSPESATYTLRMNAATSPGQWQPYTVVSPSVGSLRNDDDDRNENGKKAIG